MEDRRDGGRAPGAPARCACNSCANRHMCCRVKMDGTTRRRQVHHTFVEDSHVSVGVDGHGTRGFKASITPLAETTLIKLASDHITSHHINYTSASGAVRITQSNGMNRLSQYPPCPPGNAAAAVAACHSHVTSSREPRRPCCAGLHFSLAARSSSRASTSRRSNAGTLVPPRPRASGGGCAGVAPPAPCMDSNAATPLLALLAASRTARCVGGGSGADVVSRMNAGATLLQQLLRRPPRPQSSPTADGLLQEPELGAPGGGPRRRNWASEPAPPDTTDTSHAPAGPPLVDSGLSAPAPASRCSTSETPAPDKHLAPNGDSAAVRSVSKRACASGGPSRAPLHA